MGTRQEREGSKKTEPDLDALHWQIQELLDRREQSQKSEDDCPRKIADQQVKIERLQVEVRGLRRMVAGLGLSLGSLKKEVEDGRKGNLELEHRNDGLRKELRKAGRSWLD